MAIQFLAGAVVALAVVVLVYVILVKMESAAKRPSETIVEPLPRENESESERQLDIQEEPIPGRVIDIRQGRFSKKGE